MSRVTRELAESVADDLADRLEECDWLTYLAVERDRDTDYRVVVGVDPGVADQVIPDLDLPIAIKGVPIRVRTQSPARALAHI